MRNRPTTKNGMRYAGLPISVGLHACIIVVVLFSWPHKLDIQQENLPVVPVDLVTLSDKTNIAPMTTAAPKPEDNPSPDQTPTPNPAPNPTPPPPPKAEPAPPQVKPQPAPPKAEPAPAVKPQPAPKQPTPKQTSEDKPQPNAAPAKAQDKAKSKENFDINNIMALLDKRQSAAGSTKRGKVGPQNIKGFGAQDAMTADLRSYLQSQIYKCWNPPVGSPHADQLIVQFRILLGKDGSVSGAPQLLATGISASDPYMRAAIEAARRAIYVCSPYKLPADRYAQWKDVTFIFNPRDMIGQ